MTQAAMTLDDLRQKIHDGTIQIAAPQVSIIDSGTLLKKAGGYSPYTVEKGSNIIAAINCDHLWAKARLDLYKLIHDQNPTEDELTSIFQSIQDEDDHWDWFSKSLRCKGSEYEWFYLHADNKPQAACLIYHPQASALGPNNIFYVEFLAVAPWNRENKVQQRIYKKVGSQLLTSVLKFAVEQLGLTPGFSLHSLPQAQVYYQQLKMVNITEKDDHRLKYYELPLSEAIQLLGVA